MTAAHCPRCDREWRPWPLGRHYGCAPKGWASCIRNERRPEQERRAACLLCGGRCDPDRWVCSNCHPRLLRLAVESTLEEARRDGAMAEPVVGGEDSGAGAQRQSAKTEDRY